MNRMIVLAAAVAAASLAAMASPARADTAADAAACKQADGAFLTGTVIRGPRFANGKPQHGVYLSHTHVTIKTNDGGSYDVAIDNVFANGYQRNRRYVPAPLSSIHVGDQLEVCGRTYQDATPGIDWVHTNCGATPTSSEPDGWVRRIDAAGNAGDNMESNQTFCSIFPRR